MKLILEIKNKVDHYAKVNKKKKEKETKTNMG